MIKIIQMFLAVFFLICLFSYANPCFLIKPEHVTESRHFLALFQHAEQRRGAWLHCHCDGLEDKLERKVARRQEEFMSNVAVLVSGRCLCGRGQRWVSVSAATHTTTAPSSMLGSLVEHVGTLHCSYVTAASIPVTLIVVPPTHSQWKNATPFHAVSDHAELHAGARGAGNIGRAVVQSLWQWHHY